MAVKFHHALILTEILGWVIDEITYTNTVEILYHSTVYNNTVAGLTLITEHIVGCNSFG